MGELLAPQPPPWLLGCCWVRDGEVETVVQVAAKEGAVLSLSEQHGMRWDFAPELAGLRNERAGDEELLAAASLSEPAGQAVSCKLKTKCSKSRGRYVVLEGTAGALPLAVGTPVMQCQASAAVVADQSLDTTCHACFQPLKAKVLRCGGCMAAHYCSRPCLEADEALHELVCERVGRVVSEAAGGSSSSSQAQLLPGEAELARLALDVMARCFLAFKGGGAAPMLAQLQELVSHADRVPDEVKEEVARLGDRIARPTTATIGGSSAGSEPRPSDLLTSLWDRRELTELLLKLRFNSHPATLGSGGSRVLGLFLPAAALNHSCVPSLALSFTTTMASTPTTTQHQQGPPVWLQLRCVRAVGAGEELSYSYLSALHLPGPERRALLRSSFLFTCRCARCRQESDQAAALSSTRGVAKEEEATCVRQSGGGGGSSGTAAAGPGSGLAVVGSARQAAARCAAAGGKGKQAEAESAAESLLHWLSSLDARGWLGPTHSLRSEAATLLLSLGQAAGQQQAIATATGLLDHVLCTEGLTCLPQRADLLVLRARALAALAHPPLAGQGHHGADHVPQQQQAARLSHQAGRLAAAIYALSLGPNHPMTQGARRTYAKGPAQQAE